LLIRLLMLALNLLPWRRALRVSRRGRGRVLILSWVTVLLRHDAGLLLGPEINQGHRKVPTNSVGKVIL
jgi:hypothetical protein